VHQENLLNWEAYFRYYVTRMCDMEGIGFDEDCFVNWFNPDWNAGQSLAEVFGAMRERAANGKPARPGRIRWDLKGPIDPDTEENSQWWCRFTGPSGETVR